MSAGRFKAIDALRRRSRQTDALTSFARETPLVEPPPEISETEIEDGLRLIFLCCHPANPPEAQVALTLREERIPFEVPVDEIPQRLNTALRVVYLVFNEGYSASSGESLVRAELSAEAIRLGRILADLSPSGETLGLLALMLLQESRRDARLSSEGELLLLDEQDRSLWNAAAVEEGLALVEKALLRGPGSYALQAAIAALHAEAKSLETTDWPQIVALYDLLLGIDPSPVVALNRAVAVAGRDGAGAALKLVEEIVAAGTLRDYHLVHAVRADLQRRLGQIGDARLSYEKALYSARQQTERRFLHRRLASLSES